MPAALDISIDCLAILPESAAAETSEDVSHFPAEEVNPLIYDSRIDFPILEAVSYTHLTLPTTERV